MKVLLVSHNYPPAHTGGTELYTAQLARGLTERGYDVVVFTAEKDIARRQHSVALRQYEGVRVHEFVNNLALDGFQETWDYPPAEAAFEAVLEKERPDLVHVNHLLYLSVGCVEAAARRKIPVVFTLHDYWLQCARFGQRVHADESICLEIDESRCADCLGSFRYSNSVWEQRVAGWISNVRKVSGVDFAAGARRAGDWLRSKESAKEARALPLDEVQARNRGLLERLLPHVNRFLSPSAFLRNALVEWGVPAERLQHLRTGTDLDLFGGGERTPRGKTLHFGFIGSLIPVKGAHIALEAFGRLTASERECATLVLYGPAFHDADYHNSLVSLARASSAQLAGSLDRSEVAKVLRALDLLIVPSLWFENQPLVILEALAAETPLCVTDLGGMAELVEPGRSGFRFPVGDVDALATILRELIADPERLDELYSEPVRLPSVADQLDEIEKVYREVGSEAERS